MDYQFLTLTEQRSFSPHRLAQLEAEHYENALRREETLTYPDDHPDKAALMARWDANLAVIEVSHAALLAERDRLEAVPDTSTDNQPCPAVPIEPTPYEPPAEPQPEPEPETV